MADEGYRLRYPLYLDIAGRRVVVIGGGTVAERKVAGLLPCGPRVDVVAPRVTSSLERLAQTGELVWTRRAFEPEDLDGSVLAFCAVGESATTSLVRRAAIERGVPLNVVDEPDLCDFIVPSVVRRGPVQCAISTSGRAPGVAASMRRDLEERYPDSWGDYVLLVGRARDLVKAWYPHDAGLRRSLVERVCSPDVFARLDAGERLTPELLVEEARRAVAADGEEGRT